MPGPDSIPLTLLVANKITRQQIYLFFEMMSAEHRTGMYRGQQRLNHKLITILSMHSIRNPKRALISAAS